MIKAYLFYYDSELYAFTATKKIADKFMKQRCMKKFVHRFEKLTNLEWSLLSSKHRSKLLIEDPFDTKDSTIDIVATYTEDDALSNFLLKLEKAKDRSTTLVEDIGFTKEIEKILQKGFQEIYRLNKKGELILNIDALSILIWLFEPTFTGCGNIKVPTDVDFPLNGLR